MKAVSNQRQGHGKDSSGVVSELVRDTREICHFKRKKENEELSSVEKLCLVRQK